MEKTGEKMLLVLLVLILISLNYNSINGFLVRNFDNRELVVVERVIDGDTIVVNGTSVRLLGINTPERGEFYYEEAKEFLEKLVLNSEIEIEKQGKDKYYRDLGYLFSSGENINVKMVEEGFANYYFYSGRDIYSQELIEAWESCIEEEVNLCEKSENVCGNCVKIESESSIVNSCSSSCNIESWEISVEGRSKVEFEGLVASGERKMFDLDLSDSGRSLFLRDETGNLVSWGIY